MHRIMITVLLAVLAAGCNQRDLRAEQQQECREAGGVYHAGNDPDDDVCVISREQVIIFDDREPESN